MLIIKVGGADQGIFASTAPWYWAAGLPAIPLNSIQATKRDPKKNAKAPAVSAWQLHSDREVSSEQKQTWLSSFPSGNIGLVLGKQAGVVMVDIDIDDSSMLKAIQAVLPASPWHRRGRKGLMLVYRFSGERTFRIKSRQGAMIVELLSSTTQCVLPPSIHPETGKPYTANCNLFDADVRAQILPLPDNLQSTLRDTLKANGVDLATASVSKWRKPVSTSRSLTLATPIEEGSRDVSATALAGTYSRKVLQGDLTLLEAADFCMMECVERLKGPDAPDPDKFWCKVIEFFKRDTLRHPNTGKPNSVTLFNADGDKDEIQVQRAPYGWDAGMTRSERIAYGVDDVASAYGEYWIARHYILDAQTNEFIDKEKGERVPVDELLRRDVGAYVADHPVTRRQIETVTRVPKLERAHYSRLLPDRAPGQVVTDDPQNYKVYNSYQGFAVEPILNTTDADVGPFLTLVRTMFPHEDIAEIIFDWIAFQFQRPGDKVLWALILISAANGVGKGTIARVIRCLLHPSHFRQITTETLLSNFNGYLKDTQVVFVDEVMSGERLDATNKLKGYISESTFMWNEKHARARERPNYANWLLATNHENALRLDADDRRFCVMRVENEDAERVKAEIDFTQLNMWLDDLSNQMRLLGWFLHRDLTAFRPKDRAPWTRAKADAIALARPRWQGFLHEEHSARRGVFTADLVTVERIVATLDFERLPASAAQVAACLRQMGARDIGRRRGVGEAKGQRAVWAIANAGHWQEASTEAVRAEVRRAPIFDGVAFGFSGSEPGSGTPLIGNRETTRSHAHTTNRRHDDKGLQQSQASEVGGNSLGESLTPGETRSPPTKRLQDVAGVLGWSYDQSGLMQGDLAAIEHTRVRADAWARGEPPIRPDSDQVVALHQMFGLTARDIL